MKQKLKSMNKIPRETRRILAYEPNDFDFKCPHIIQHYNLKIWIDIYTSMHYEISYFIGWLPLPEVEL